MKIVILYVCQEFHLENDPTSIHQTAQGLLMLQFLYGMIPRVTGIGPAAQKVADFMKKLAQEQSGSQSSSRYLVTMAVLLNGSLILNLYSDSIM